ncbi:PH domain-containing protein [Bengtsoniella intestinalis]|uniref:PH domain-containing protein n=1 Tax=Bengtsoniella intestinalis TaxID=3073143 RepID=UPI00391F74B9
MIDFENAKFLKLRRVKDTDFEALLQPMFVEDEGIVSTYRTVRDGVVFTNRRIIAINVQGVTGKKKAITSLPYRKIQTYAIETSGVLDLDSELKVTFSGMGTMTFEFTANANVAEICQYISYCTL